MNNKQLSIPGLPVPEAKTHPLTQDERINELTDRVCRLELEVSLLRILLEKGDKDHV